MLRRAYDGFCRSLQNALFVQSKTAISPETIKAIEDTTRAVLDSRLSQLCTNKEQIKGNIIDLQSVFPAFY
jgi:hypothetical protein